MIRFEPRNSFLARFQVTFPSALELLSSDSEMSELPPGYHPADDDVVCGRGKGSYNRPGNKRFRVIVNSFIPEYTAVTSKIDKSIVLNKIIDVVKEQSDGTARFIKFDGKTRSWYVIPDEQAREKVGHAIREAITALEQLEQKQHSKQVFDVKQLDLLALQQQFFGRLVDPSATTSLMTGI